MHACIGNANRKVATHTADTAIYITIKRSQNALFVAVKINNNFKVVVTRKSDLQYDAQHGYPPP